MLADEAFDDGVAGPVQLCKEGRINHFTYYTMTNLQRVLMEKVSLWPSLLVRVVSAANWSTDRAEVITNCNENLTEHK